MVKYILCKEKETKYLKPTNSFNYKKETIIGKSLIITNLKHKIKSSSFKF